MRLICLADTHNQHHEIAIPEGDVLIHAGDCTDGGTERETLKFLEWFSAMPHKFKILVPGNHDFYFEKFSFENILPGQIHLLIDSGVEINGYEFWGSPYIPSDGSWAFSRERGSEIRKHWEMIPSSTNILITHTPPYKILDEIQSGFNLGCEELSHKIEILQLTHHIFGHIHFSSGSVKRKGVNYHNTAILNEKYKIYTPPKVIDLS